MVNAFPRDCVVFTSEFSKIISENGNGGAPQVSVRRSLLSLPHELQHDPSMNPSDGRDGRGSSSRDLNRLEASLNQSGYLRPPQDLLGVDN